MSQPDRSGPPWRKRNRRGDGGRLREEIVAAATELADRAPSDGPLSLRAVARQVGVSAPSLYDHFADLAEILDAVADRGFTMLTETVTAAAVGNDDPRQALSTGCRAYLRFATEHPGLYATMFATPCLKKPTEQPPPEAGWQPERPTAATAFDVLRRAIERGTTGPRDAVEPGITTGPGTSGPASVTPLDVQQDTRTAALAVWVALHGIATLHLDPALPHPDHLVDVVLQRLVDARIGEDQSPHSTTAS